MYCREEPDETLIIIKSKWTQQLRDKGLLIAVRRSCNSNFRLIQVYLRASTQCQSLDCHDQDCELLTFVECTELLGINFELNKNK